MITSLSNSRIKHLVTLREKSRSRNKEGLFIAEGIRMFGEAPQEKLREVYYSKSFLALLEQGNQAGRLGLTDDREEADRRKGALQKLLTSREQGVFVESVSDEVFQKITDTCTPQGILFVMEQFSYSLEEMVGQAKDRQEAGGKMPLFLILEDIQDPGNLGTMLRTAEGAGASGVILSRGCVDVYNPKTIRSTMGSLYRVPFVYQEDLKDAVCMVRAGGVTVYAAHLAGERYFDRSGKSGNYAADGGRGRRQRRDPKQGLRGRL